MIRHIAKARYNHDLTRQSFQYPFHKLSCLRELCLQLGLQITANYQIVNIHPVVKAIDIHSDEAKFNQEMGTKLIKEQRY